jgi:hypothetical protein
MIVAEAHGNLVMHDDGEAFSGGDGKPFFYGKVDSVVPSVLKRFFSPGDKGPVGGVGIVIIEGNNIPLYRGIGRGCLRGNTFQDRLSGRLRLIGQGAFHFHGKEALL